MRLRQFLPLARAADYLSSVRRRPRSAALRQARSIAFVVANPSHAVRQSWIAAAQSRGAHVDIFSLGLPHRDAEGRILSFVAPPPRQSYDCVVVSDRIELFEHSWSYAFLDRCNKLAAPDGVVVVPARYDPVCSIPRPRLCSLFGRGREEASSTSLTFRHVPNGLHRPSEAAHSTLDAYWPLMETLIYGRFDPRLGETVSGLGVSPAEPRSDPEADLFGAIHSQAYRTCSARTKAALAQYIVSRYFPGRNDLRMADLGAGTGLNSLELLLNPGQVSHLILVEPRRSYHWDIAAMYERMREHLHGQVRIVAQTVEDYSGPGIDIGLVCGVLVMVPREIRKRFLANAWENLRPGGILMVLENMRAAEDTDGGKYNAQRCTPAEIDALLGRFAPIRYFMSTAKRELRFKQVGDQPVFRIIQKPA
ncbi:MAG TPA: class I SAM-dependent methyltransferase [Rhizomicrobium sp.]|nr:class I SAM-dependent methyltransferase [Rhizomicrobium sp.]